MAMKRVQMYIDPDLDHVLRAEAKRRKVSMASLLRDAAREKFLPAKRQPDPLDALVGDCPDAEPIDDIDGFLYGPKRSV